LVGDGITKVARLVQGPGSVYAAAGGLGAGSAAAVGSWSLVALVGSASTGTTIGTLSGAAATNATLAWFGGGALAAGGAGMAGGMLVLGGLACAPAIAFAVWHSRSKLKQIATEVEHLQSEMTALESRQSEQRKLRATILAQTYQIRSLASSLTDTLCLVNKKIFPFRFFSFAHRLIKEFMGADVFSAEELVLIRRLEVASVQLAAPFKV
jgi:outer membrane murein-binding lipoprotein Lpp